MNGPQHVAIVEDDLGLRTAMYRLLTAAGVHTHAYPCAEDLLAAAHADLDFVVIDIHLPGMSGFDLPPHLRGVGKAAGLIFITAYDDADSRRRAAAAGGVYLVKPFAGHALLHALGAQASP
ncbi:MAG: response regulator [Rhodocyclaceae bacterium]